MSDKDGAYAPVQEYSCEICGLSGLTDDLMRKHTRACHVEGNAQCPFCGFGGVAPAELLLHVNQAHLDYLTPENELISFIDDHSPSLDGDSDSISECRAIISPQHHNLIQPALHQHHKLTSNTFKNKNIESTTNNLSVLSSCKIQSMDNWYKLATNSDSKHHFLNEECVPSRSNVNSNCFSASSSQHSSNKQQPQQKAYDKSKNCDTVVNGTYNDNSNNVNSKDVIEISNGVPAGGQGQGSPLRSQLGLKLKGLAPPAITASSTGITGAGTINKKQSLQQSPLQCPLCPHTSDNATYLEEHINRSHFDPLSPGVNGSTSSNTYFNTLSAFQCPICTQVFGSSSDLELHVNIEHKDILSPGKPSNSNETISSLKNDGTSICPVCNMVLDNTKIKDVEVHIEQHFEKSPRQLKFDSDLEKEAQKLREQREFEMLRAQYGMDDQGNFREQSAAAMQRAVYAGEMSVADYYERQVGLRAAESHGIDDGSSCTKSVTPRTLSLSASSPGVIKSLVCSSVDHYASSYGDKGWGCGYRNLQMLLSSLLQNTTYNEALYSAWGTHGPSRTAMPSISRLQKMVEAAWAQGFDVQGSEQLGCKLYNTRKWIGATEVMTVLSWLRINCQLIDFHRPTSLDGRHPELFNWVFEYFDTPRVHTPPLYLQHQGHSRTIIGIEQRASGLTLLVLDPSHGPRQVAALGSSQDSLRLIRRGTSAMRAPQYQIVAVTGLIETEEQYQASKILRSLRIPPDR